MIYLSTDRWQNQHQSENGFSLLEMLIALSIFAGISLMGLIVLRSFVDGQSALKNTDERVSQIQMAGNIVRDDLANAVIRSARGKLGGVGRYFDGGIQDAVFGADELPLLRFVRGGHTASLFDQSLPNIQTLEYWFQDGALFRRSYARPDATEETPIASQELLDDLSGLSVRFRVQGTWVDGLEAITGARQSLPELVEMKFSFVEGDSITRVFAVGVDR